MEQNPVTPDDTTTSLFVTMEGMMHAVHAQFYFSPTSSPELRTQAFANYLQSERDLYSGARSVPDQLIYHVDFPHSVVVPPLEQFDRDELKFIRFFHESGGIQRHVIPLRVLTYTSQMKNSASFAE